MFSKISAAVDRFKRRISPRAFTRGALLLSALWFLGLYPALNLFAPAWLPNGVRPGYVDFGQYYAGALTAREGLWEALYPIPKPEIYGQPPQFKPAVATFFFSEGTSRPELYPPVAVPEASDFSPKLLALCPELKEHFSYRYMYPPPLALLLRPLAAWSFETARQHVWPILGMAGLFGLALCSARIYRRLHGGDSHAEGLILAAVTVFSLRGPCAVAEGNATPLLGFLIAFSVLSWMRNRQAAVGMAMIPLLLFKMIGLTWCPLLLLRKIRWGTLATLAALTAALNGAMLLQAGPGIYRQYFSEILPKLAMPVGEGFPARIFAAFGFYPAGVYLGLSLLLCGALYYGYWRGMRAAEPVRRDATVAATLAGTMAVFCSLNFSIWAHYFPAYALFPFLGWLLWEAGQASGAWRRGMLAGIALSYFFAAFNWVPRGALLLLAGRAATEAYTDWISRPAYTFFCPLFFLIVAFRRLYGRPAGEAKAGSPLAPGSLHAR